MTILVVANVVRRQRVVEAPEQIELYRSEVMVRVEYRSLAACEPQRPACGAVMLITYARS